MVAASRPRQPIKIGHLRRDSLTLPPQKNINSTSHKHTGNTIADSLKVEARKVRRNTANK
jgi:hypothetical protein